MLSPIWQWRPGAPLEFLVQEGAFAAHGLRVAPGDVFAWSCPPPIGKRTYHLRVADYDFVFLNTPKDRHFPSDFYIRAQDMRFLTPTGQEFSAVGCVDIQAIGNQASFRSRTPQHLGNLATPILFNVLEHMCRLPTFAIEDVERLAEVVETMRPIVSQPRPVGRQAIRR